MAEEVIETMKEDLLPVSDPTGAEGDADAEKDLVNNDGDDDVAKVSENEEDYEEQVMKI